MSEFATEDYAQEFVDALLRTGMLLCGLLDNLTDSLPEDAYPGESHVEVVLEMIAGTLRPVLNAAGDGFIRDVIALLEDSQNKVLTDLCLAMELARRREQMIGREEPLN